MTLLAPPRPAAADPGPAPARAPGRRRGGPGRAVRLGLLEVAAWLATDAYLTSLQAALDQAAR